MTSEGLQLKLKTIQSGFYYNQEKHPLYISLLSNIQSWQESDTFWKYQDENPRTWLFQQKRSQGLEDAMTRLSENDIPGKLHIEDYLRDQYRRNCRPNTLRNSLTSIALFLLFIKKLGKTRLE